MPDPHTHAHTHVFGGVDTHTDTHHAAALDHLGRVLGDAQFPTTPDGCAALRVWLASFGPVTAVGVEGTGSYGKQLATFLRQHHVQVAEVARPNRRTRRSQGKSDVIDAISAARAVLSGDTTATPKTGDGPVESIRALRVVRRGAVKARTAALNELTNLITTAPAALRETLRGKPRAAQLTACHALKPDLTRLADPAHGVMLALRAAAERITSLTQQITQLDKHLDRLVAATAPTLVSLLGFGTDTVGQLLVTAGDNPDRLRSEGSLAKLCGVAPLEASSGRTDKHRLNKGGDRQANRALHVVAVVRLRYCPRTRAYLERRTAQGLSKRDILRCLKRYILREAYAAITKDLAHTA
jgi:transposase